jgi:hypothetical protein
MLLNLVIKNIGEFLVELIGLGEGPFHALDLFGSDLVDFDVFVEGLVVG